MKTTKGILNTKLTLLILSINLTLTQYELESLKMQLLLEKQKYDLNKLKSH